MFSGSLLKFRRYLERLGVYRRFDTDDGRTPISASALPKNTTTQSLTDGIAVAHLAYGSPKAEVATETGVLFVIQPNNINISDERPIEYVLGNREPPIPAYRLEFPDQVLAHTSLTESRELLYHPPENPTLSPIEISVVYMRAGYDADEYDSLGCAARFHLERSRAIKCPSLLAHIATFKKVQQALAMPGTLKRFISSPADIARVSSTFAGMYPLDTSDIGKQARLLALDPATAINFVLKPSLEGGGHNVYGGDIPGFLKSIPEALWSNYILMEFIRPPAQHGHLLSSKGFYSGPVVCELGIFGICLWRKTPTGHEMVGERREGWSFKTKPAKINEMSVVKGYGCFDSPCLVKTELACENN